MTHRGPLCPLLHPCGMTDGAAVALLTLEGGLVLVWRYVADGPQRPSPLSL